MGLDVDLCQFKEVDTDAILQFSQWLYEPLEGGNAMARTKQDFINKARELGLPEDTCRQDYFGGTRISFVSKKGFKCFPVGTWYGLGTVRGLMIELVGKDFYHVIPEAKGDPHWIRPDWAASKERLSDVFEEIKNLEPLQIANRSQYWGRRVESDLKFVFDDALNEIEVMIETFDYVLSQDDPRQFLLCWSS